MREILFRAKRVDNGEWAEGYYAKLKWCNNIIYVAIPNEAEIDSGNSLCETHEINPETICQYTGMVDKNGNRIWENDIVQTPFRRFVVTYFDGVWGDRYGVAMRESIFGEGGVVIGNVFDNPELMEQEKETEDSHGE